MFTPERSASFVRRRLHTLELHDKSISSVSTAQATTMVGPTFAVIMVPSYVQKVSCMHAMTAPREMAMTPPMMTG